MLSFQRAVGAAADAREIEYVSAIHQGTPWTRPDGSITAPDVSHFLLSRYGIQVEEDEVQETIIKGYGGAATEEDCIDLAELTATILIPFLHKATRGQIDGPPGETSEHGREAEGNGGSSGGGEDGDVVRTVLRMILGDVTGSTTPATVDRDLVRRILVTYGEAELSRDDGIVDEMIAAATGGQEGVALDERAFARAIAGDIQQYDVESETNVKSNYRDVFPKEKEEELLALRPSGTKETSSGYSETTCPDEEASDAPKSDKAHRPKEVLTANGIDFIADTHRSKLFVVFLWAFFIMTQRTYLPNPTGAMDNNGNGCEDADFFCIVSSRIVRWIFLTLSYIIGGTLFITIGSWGNGFEATTPWPSVISILCMLTAAVVPFWLVATDSVNQNRSEEYLILVTFTFGIIVVLLQVIYLLGRLPRCRARVLGSRGVEKVFAALQTGNVLVESYVKEAAAKKTRLIVRNALEVHGQIDETDIGTDKSYSRALLNFAKQGESHETCGSLWWTWHHIWTWKLSQVEGVLIPSKLLTANILQLIMSVFVTIVLIISTNRTATAVEDYLNNATNVDFEEEFVYRADKLILAHWSSRNDPKPIIDNLKSSILLSGYIGSALCFVVCLVLTLAYLPSVVRTTLKFRCGDFPSLCDASFFKYMIAPDTVSKVPGSMFWAIFHAGVAVFFTCAVVVFLFAFQLTRNMAYEAVAQIIGFLLPTVFKLIVLIVLRNRFYAGQYRRQPVAANFMGLALQCLDYGLAFGYMLFRAIKLVLVPVYYIGRVDTPVFAPKVGSIGALDLDDSPIHFRKLIIGHEAHRHPYIEVLGKMYLLKLRHRDGFGNTSGSHWRMIFVSALMPWMRRHRIVFDDDDDGSFAAELDRTFRRASRSARLSFQGSERAVSEFSESKYSTGFRMVGSSASLSFRRSERAVSESIVSKYSTGVLSPGTDATHEHNQPSTDDYEEERRADE